MTDHDPLFDALKPPAPVDVDDWRKENIRLRARAELSRASRPAPLADLYRRVIEPATVAALSGGWLAWAAQRVLMIHGG